MTNAQSTIDLHQYWDIIRSRKFEIIIPIVLALALAAAYVYSQKPKYTAEAKVLVNAVVTPGTTTGTAKGNAPDMVTEQAAASSTPVALIARRSLNLSPSQGGRLLGHLTVTAATTGNILQFQYSSTNPQQAAQYVNAFAQAYLTYRNSTAQKPLANAVASRQRAIAAIQSQLGVRHIRPAERVLLEAELHEDVIQLAQFQSDQQLISAGNVITTAVAPASPSSPKVKKILLIAGVIGLLIGICIALIREAMHAKIRRPDDMASRLQAPVLGVIPWFPAQTPEQALVTVSNPRSPASEAYRMTAMTLEHLATEHHLRTIVTVSPQPGGGTSTSTANLGVALAQAGHRVILVSGDMRSPRLQLLFSLTNRHGFANALGEGLDPESLLKETLIPNLYVITSGPEPSNPAALLSSPATAEVLGTLRKLEADFILVDSPAMLPASDALILACRVDATIFSWNADLEAAYLSAAQERLRAAGANIVGGIYSFDGSRSRRRSARRVGKRADESEAAPPAQEPTREAPERSTADRVEYYSQKPSDGTGSARSRRRVSP